MVLNSSFLKLNKIHILLVLACVLFYVSFSYDLARTDHFKFITLYSALFFLFYKLIEISKHNFRFLLVISVLFRLVFLLATPNLSQDFYRFIWDGRMIFEGFNPYLFTPESFISQSVFPITQAQELYAGMGELNGSHYTNYPPINQLCFLIAALVSKSSILGSAIVMRLLIIAADIGTLYFGKKLLEKLKIPVHNIFWYILNPFIIIELTGNLHFEGIMIFFLVWSLYLLHTGKWKWAAVVLALSISTKLIPLMLLPLFYQWFMKNKATTTFNNLLRLISFYAIVGLVTIILFAPFFSSAFINNYAQTVGLWFSDFEFNASLYYIAREFGYWITGYNEIAVIGKIIPVAVILFVVIVAFIRKNLTTTQLITAMLFVFSFYLFSSTTVHPWYIATLLFLGVFTKYKFPLVWSFIIVISYLAYANSNNNENLWIIALEYIIVYSVFIWEVILNKPLFQKTPNVLLPHNNHS